MFPGEAKKQTSIYFLRKGAMAMKKLLAMIIVILLTFSACSQANGATSPDDKTGETGPSETEGTQPSELNNNGEVTDKDTLDSTNTPINVTFDSYDSIIKTYKKMVEIIPDKIETDEIYSEPLKKVFNIPEAKMEWFIQLTMSIAEFYPKDYNGLKHDGYDDFGYAVKDINGDGSDELLLMLSDGTIIAIFTTHNDEPVLLDCFRYRSYCQLNSAGEICVSGSSGAANSVIQEYTIDAHNAKLSLICEYGSDGFDAATGETIYFFRANSVKTYITKAEFQEYCESNRAMTPSQLLEFLTYIPLKASTEENGNEGMEESQLSETEKMLLDVMNNKAEFAAENGERTLLRNYEIPNTLGTLAEGADAYTFVDLDQDGSKELAVRCTTDYGLYIILRYNAADATVYGYSIGTRAFIEVKTDGRFLGSSGAAFNYISRAEFDGTKMVVIDLAYKNDFDGIYEIKGKAVTKEEMEAYWFAWEQAENCVWLKKGIESNVQSHIIPEEYLPVIKNQEKIWIRGEEFLFREYIPFLQMEAAQQDTVEYTALDMDGDGNRELLIRGGLQDILVLHKENGAVYGYHFSFRAMYYVNFDGTYSWNSDAGTTYGLSKLAFTGETYRQTELYRVSNDGEDAKYFISNLEVTKKVFEDYNKTYPTAERATWYPLK